MSTIYCTTPLCKEIAVYSLLGSNNSVCLNHSKGFDPALIQPIEPTPLLTEEEKTIIESGSQPIATGANGGKRRMLDYSLTSIPLAGLIRIGKRFAYGATRYGRGNWRKFAGDHDMRLEACNHAIAHLMRYAHWLETGEDLSNGDDDLAAVGWYVVTEAEISRLETKKEDGDA